MSLLPITLIGVLLIAAVVAALGARRLPTVTTLSTSPGRSHVLVAVALLVPLLVWLVWPGARLGERAATWQLTGSALWLLAAVAARLVLGRAVDGRIASQLAASFVLTAAALPALWAVDARARLVAVALLGAVWLAGQWWAAGRRVAAWPVVAWLAAVMLLWLAAIVDSAALLTTAAATLLLGIWPLADGLWRTDDSAPLVVGLPVVAGAGLLLPVLGVALPPVVLVAATAVGLLAAFVGLARLRRRTPRGVARSLAPALGGLVLLAGAWGGVAALLPAVRLAVFAPAALALLGPAAGRGRWARLAIVAVVYAALAGLPFTVGAGALARTYSQWLPAGIVLLIVVVGIVALWLAVVYRAASKGGNGTATGQSPLVALLPAGLAAAALVQIDMSVLALPPLAWAGVGLAALLGVVVGRFVPGLWHVAGLARESFAVGPLLAGLGTRFGPPARRASAATTAALSDAVAILEGENGLLLLLALLALLFWLGR